MDESALFRRHITPLAPLPVGLAPRLAPTKHFRAMLFDVYGTLLISAAGEITGEGQGFEKNGQLARMLERHGITRSPERLQKALRQEIEREHARLRKEGVDWPEVDIHRVWQAVLGGRAGIDLKKLVLEFELIVNPVYPMPGLRRLLSACRSRRLPAGVISNAQATTLRLLEWFLESPPNAWGLDPGLCFYSYRTGHAKPSTVMFARAARALGKMGIAAESALFVGNDMRNDILPATAVGFKTALFAGDRRSLRLRENDEACRGLSPDLVITDLRQLIPPAGPRRWFHEKTS